MSLKKTKTIGKGSQSFQREFDQSEFTLDEKRADDVKFLMSQPQRGKKVLDYFIRSGLKYKEVFDAINITELSVAEQKGHQLKIAAMLRGMGWQGKIDLHTRPMGEYDHPSPHFHLWGSQIDKSVYEAVSTYLVMNELTYSDRLKAMKAARVIPKIPREEIKQIKESVAVSAEPTILPDIIVRKRKSGASKRLEEFTGKFKYSDPDTQATVEQISLQVSAVNQKISDIKAAIKGSKRPVVIQSDEKRKGIDEKFEASVQRLHDRIQKIKQSLSANS